MLFFHRYPKIRSSKDSRKNTSSRYRKRVFSETCGIIIVVQEIRRSATRKSIPGLDNAPARALPFSLEFGNGSAPNRKRRIIRSYLSPTTALASGVSRVLGLTSFTISKLVFRAWRRRCRTKFKSGPLVEQSISIWNELWKKFGA